MNMKRFIKDILAQIDYSFYRMGLKKCYIKVHTMDETIEELIHGDKSMVRFGDGEISMIRGRSLQLQQVKPEIMEGLKRLLSYEHEGLIVAIPEIFDDLSLYRKESRQFWKDHLFFSRKVYEKYCNCDKTYYNAYVSRFYYAFDDKSLCDDWAAKIRRIWKDKNVVVVEGERTHNGVGNDLLDMAKSVVRIIGPSSNAYEYLDDIMDECRNYPKDSLFLVSLGIAAKFLTEKLFLEGYRVLDIGNLDMEYEWYIHHSEKKEPIFKHSVTGVEENEKAGYQQYLGQVQKRIGL